MALVSSLNHTTDAPAEAKPLDLLWHIEFGNRVEVIIRCIAIAMGGISVWLYAGDIIGVLWAIVYLGGLSFSYALLRPGETDRSRPLVLNFATYIFNVITFKALPFYLLLSGDAVLMFCGAVAIAAVVIFTLLRPERPRVVHYYDIAAGWIIVMVVEIAVVPFSPGTLARGVEILMGGAIAVYYTMALIQAREARIRMRASARITCEDTKMEAIGRLSGGMAHDFNNILTVLQGSLDLYQEAPQGRSRDALIDDARAATVRATSLVSQLLTFARRAPLEARAQDADALIDDLCLLARRILPDNVDLDQRKPERPVSVLADEKALHAALLNLILNAGDAMDGPGSVTLAADIVQGPAASAGIALSETLNNAHLRFSVADNGPGMTDEVARRALEPFFTTKSVGEGSGLGLPMAKGFAEQSGGAFHIRTSQHGTTVDLHLPIAG